MREPCSDDNRLGDVRPPQIRTNADLERMVATSDEWIVSRTGIRERRIASDDESTFTLARDAAKRALQVADVHPNDIDLVVVATLTPEYGFPATASLVQDTLGATRAGAFDINAACAGFVYGLAVARSLIESGTHETILLIGADTMSRGGGLDGPLDLRALRGRRGRGGDAGHRRSGRGF